MKLSRLGGVIQRRTPTVETRDAGLSWDAYQTLF